MRSLCKGREGRVKGDALTSQVFIVLLLGVVIMQDVGVCVTVGGASSVIMRLAKFPSGKVNKEAFRSLIPMFLQM